MKNRKIKIKKIRKRIMELKRRKLSEGLFDQIMANITSRKAEDLIDQLYEKDPKLARQAERTRNQALDLKDTMEKSVDVSANL